MFYFLLCRASSFLPSLPSNLKIIIWSKKIWDIIRSWLDMISMVWDYLNKSQWFYFPCPLINGKNKQTKINFFFSISDNLNLIHWVCVLITSFSYQSINLHQLYVFELNLDQKEKESQVYINQTNQNHLIRWRSILQVNWWQLHMWFDFTDFF